MAVNNSAKNIAATKARDLAPVGA